MARALELQRELARRARTIRRVTPERTSVAALADKHHRLDAMRSLLGGVNARDLRSVQLTDAAFDALVDGLDDSNPVVRWWSIQLLDHCADQRAIDAIVPMLSDTVPRVRRNAAHALGCVVCKPDWSGTLTPEALRQLSRLANWDPNLKVRAEARSALALSAIALLTTS
jgi:HEAT repeat protein